MFTTDTQLIDRLLLYQSVALALLHACDFCQLIMNLLTLSSHAVLATDEKAWARVMGVNATGYFLGAQARRGPCRNAAWN